MPAVSWRQPSLERHKARLALVLESRAKFWTFVQFEPIVPRGSVVTRVATPQPYALAQRRADQVFQVFFNRDEPVRGIEAFLDCLRGHKRYMFSRLRFRVELSVTTKKNRGARIRPNL